MVLSGVLLLFLVACNSNDDDNGSDLVAGINSICAVVDHDGDLAERGAHFRDLSVNQLELEFKEELLESLDEFSLDGVEVSFDEESGIIFLCPVNIDQEPWVTIISDLSDNEVTSWANFVDNVMAHFFGPVFSDFAVVVASPFNADLFWLNVVDGFEIQFSAFELTDGGFGPGFSDEVYLNGRIINLKEWREWFVDDVSAEVQIPIDLIMGTETTTLEDLSGAFGPGLAVDDTQAILDLGEFIITIDLGNAEIAHATVTYNPIEQYVPETGGSSGPGGGDDYDY